MENDIWYNSKWFTVLISLSIFVLGQMITMKYQSKNEKRTLLLLITQTNLELFSIIYQGAINPSSIDYLKLREVLKKTNIIYLLPKRLKEPFKELYHIHYCTPEDYEQHKYKVPELLKNISEQMNSYGVEIFGNF